MCDFKLAHPASVALDPGPSRILEHVGACILFDSTLDRLEEPCGLCLLPSKLCRYVVVKGKGSQASLHVDWEHAPISLSHVHCPKSERYNLRFHLERVLSVEVVTPYSKLWTLSGDEMEGMRHVVSDAPCSVAPLQRMDGQDDGGVDDDGRDSSHSDVV